MINGFLGPLPSRSFLQELMSHLKTALGGWNVALLKENFLSDDVTTILSIPCSEVHYDDSICWHYLKDREYTIKSGYKAGTLPSSSSCSAGRDNWLRKLWSIKVPQKINVDAALDMDGYVVGFGLVVQNSHGLVVASSVQRVIASYSSFTAETMAVLQGLNFAIDLGVRPIVIESDALAAVKLIDSGAYSSADIGVIIGEILTKLEGIDGGSVQFVSREANYVAHTLARMGLSISDDVVWLEDYPLCVERMIHGEATA
ncbi:hypothetical protein Dsin_025196 [Dipteronia sinensis]|uniref:RNase H type-1 domain-containing protein n=1 Tax=Dipteronia sinensis TaxID=43782 RepID=A0AAD9ZVJ4_9ROSI|nr:hypothetical protein Dsin_025196 [Dipteronia sinensis]